MLTPRITPNQIRSMPSLSAAGPSSGTTMKASSKKSRKNASRKTRMLTTIRKPTWPPGSDDQQVLDPDMAVDAVEGEREHARADQDEHHEGRELGRRVQRLRSRSKVRRRLASASSMAPAAPIAPPSVGVARPMKIVPSTRKISPSGGTSTKMTCSASRREQRARRPEHACSRMRDDDRRRPPPPQPPGSAPRSRRPCDMADEAVVARRDRPTTPTTWSADAAATSTARDYAVGDPADAARLGRQGRARAFGQMIVTRKT